MVTQNLPFAPACSCWSMMGKSRDMARAESIQLSDAPVSTNAEWSCSGRLGVNPSVIRYDGSKPICTCRVGPKCSSASTPRLPPPSANPAFVILIFCFPICMAEMWEALWVQRQFVGSGMAHVQICGLRYQWPLRQTCKCLPVPHRRIPPILQNDPFPV